MPSSERGGYWLKRRGRAPEGTRHAKWMASLGEKEEAREHVSATWGKGVAGSNEEEEHTRGPDMQGRWQIWAKKKKRMSAEQGKVGCWFQRKL